MSGEKLYFVTGRAAPGEIDHDGEISGRALCIRVWGSPDAALLMGALNGDTDVMCPGSCRAFRLVSGKEWSVCEGGGTMIRGDFRAKEIPFPDFLGMCSGKVARAGNYPVFARGDGCELVTFAPGGKVELRVFPDGSWERKSPSEGWTKVSGSASGLSEAFEVHGDTGVSWGDLAHPGRNQGSTAGSWVK